MMRAQRRLRRRGRGPQAALGPPNELAVLAALSNADVIDVKRSHLRLTGYGRRRAPERRGTRQGVRSDAVVHYVRETGNAILKGCCETGASAARCKRSTIRTGRLCRGGAGSARQAMAVERVHMREMGLVKGRCYWSGAGRRPDAPSLLKWFSPFPRGYLEDFWFYARNNHPALFCLRDPAHPRGRSEALAAELVQQARDLGGGCRVAPSGPGRR